MVETKNTKVYYNVKIPGDWEVKRLEDACSHFKSGFGITSEQISDLGEFPVYGGNGLRGYTDNFTHEGDYLLIGRQGALCGNIQRVSDKVGRNRVMSKTDFIKLEFQLPDYKEQTAIAQVLQATDKSACSKPKQRS